ncbi:MAG TPA: hypothetical protein VHZ73_11870 [Vicinamibacterales bacterium]|nr:hypothetical protein [Vicinamibacterales bacterium]
MRNRLAVVVFLIGAVPSLYWMWQGLSAHAYLFGLDSSQGSGIGAVSGNFSEPIFALVALLIVLVLAAFARRRGTLARRLARVHRYTSLGVVAIALLLLPAEFVSGWSDFFREIGDKILMLSLFGFSLFLPWQAFCASAFVAFLVGKPRD